MNSAGPRTVVGLLATSFLAYSAPAAPTERTDPAAPVTQAREVYGKTTWLARHEQILERNKAVKPEIVFLGDSITHFWSGEPVSHRPTDDTSWQKTTGGRVATNLGFGFDYIENALWRVQHGELDGIAPKVIVINLGTNNLGHKGDGPADCERGMKALIVAIRAKQPAAQLLLLGIYPRHEKGLVAKLADTNVRYAKLAAENGIRFVDMTADLSEPGAPGVAEKKLFRDGLHPNAAGYALVAQKLAPEIDKLFLTAK